MQSQGPMPPPGPIAQPSPEQMAAFQRQLEADAKKAGMTVPQFIERIKQQQIAKMQQMQQQQQAQGHQHPHPHSHQHEGQQQQQGQPQPIVPGPPNPVAVALAKFLRSQPLKPRTCILNGERKDMFRVKRALRALQSPEYEKARKKNPALPEITDRASLENTFKLLPMSMLALRVTQVDEHEGHDHGPGVSHGKKGKRVKGLWTVRIEPQQEAQEDMYYAWLWEGSQVMRKVYAALALLVIFAVVLYPLWPAKLRMGVYYLSWGFLIFLGLFFAMAIFRVILFCITYFVLAPGFWLFPNLWEDVSVVESFKPVWAWHDPNPKKKKKSKSSAVSASAGSTFSATTGQPAPATATTTATATQVLTEPHQRSYVAPRVEELGDDE
ncbi:translocation protein Sec62-domain-containing protein [Lasiosphaeria miniovina]|uniref:Translocation protein SEC62 n=1 Tax=Lasiosphaeria miniovina TaxID=1954250 RepID=A0AA39ZQS6_9PEZI|nr:translocation protein Sec62-domain-containing protein [Lasiosphaeria miniovina]KAK0701829.1 translocation protein Sec62-domain-containing protein [Lasiosphaeria miniovina]